jgi:molybdate transport system regulatory protein
MKPKARLYLDTVDGLNLFGDGRYRLLKTIDEEGSLSRATLTLSRGYRKAWNDIQNTERALGRKLVVSSRGGPGGGTTELTDFARRLLAGWQSYRREVMSCIERATVDHLGFLADADRKRPAGPISEADTSTVADGRESLET